MNKLDKFYTKPKIANYCVILFKKYFCVTKKDLIIEPSAGNGSFLEALDKIDCKKCYLDIVPENDKILEQDFLEFTIPRMSNKIHVIGNPPFGKQSSTAIKFIKHAATFADSINFILPRSFKKNSLKNKIPLNFHLIHEYDLPQHSFLLNNKSFNVPCVFQIWKKSTKNREKIVKLEPKNIIFVKQNQNPDVAFCRVGSKAGQFSFNWKNKSVQTHYFIKFKTFEIFEKFLRLRKTFCFPTNNTVGAKSISQQEFILNCDKFLGSNKPKKFGRKEITQRSMKKKDANLFEIKIIYKTTKQFWSIDESCLKKRISKKTFESFLFTKKLINYKDSKFVKKNYPFKILENKIEIVFKNTIQFIPILNKTCDQYTFIDIFSGAGGFSHGFVNTGYIPLLCIDKNKDACETLKKNHLNAPVICDKIENFNFSKFKGKVDVVVGGSPCQSFSSAGLKKGLQDKNGQAFLKFIEVIFKIRPKVFIIENVKGLLAHQEGKTFKHLLKLLLKDNIYKIEYELINMFEYGVPQKRHRVFIIGFLSSLNVTNFFPLPKTHKIQLLKDVLNDVPYSRGVNYSEKKKKLFKMIPAGGCWINLPKDLQQNYLGKNWDSGGGQRGVLRRLSMTEPSLTLLCSPSQKRTERCHPIYERPLTIREYARIQTFSDNYSFHGSINSQYRQIGNAVPVIFSSQLAVRLLKIFKEYDGKEI